MKGIKRRRLAICPRKIWRFGRKCGWTDYKWNQINKRFILALNNKTTTLGELSDFAFDNGASLKIEFKEVAK